MAVHNKIWSRVDEHTFIVSSRAAAAHQFCCPIKVWSKLCGMMSRSFSLRALPAPANDYGAADVHLPKFQGFLSLLTFSEIQP